MNAARAKVELEAERGDGCRVCGDCNPDHLDAAHLWDRSQGGGGFDDPDLIVPLCSRIKGGAGHHDDYDAHRLDLRPYLTRTEEVAIVRVAGLERARTRLMGTRPSVRQRDDGPF